MNAETPTLSIPKLEILPPGPPSKLETYKIMRNVRKAHIPSAKRKDPCGRGSRCSLVQSQPYFGSILSNKFIYLLLLLIYLFFIQHNLSGRKSNSSGRAGDFGKFASKREISHPNRESWSLCEYSKIVWTSFMMASKNDIKARIMSFQYLEKV